MTKTQQRLFRRPLNNLFVTNLLSAHKNDETDEVPHVVRGSVGVGPGALEDGSHRFIQMMDADRVDRGRISFAV